MNPSIWFEKTNDEYKAQLGKIPTYIEDDQSKMSNKRQFVPSTWKKQKLVFRTENEMHPTYDAFKQDIAMVNFHFDKTSGLQFKRAPRLTLLDFISQMGGLLGLGIGFSLVSGAEIIYWLTIRLFLNFKTYNERATKQPDKEETQRAVVNRGKSSSLPIVE